MSIDTIKTKGDLERFIAEQVGRTRYNQLIDAPPAYAEEEIIPDGVTDWTHTNVAYYKDRSRVYLRGAVNRTGGATTTAFELPEGYRPPTARVFNVATVGGTSFVTVATNGAVTPADPTALTYLDQVTFRV